MHQTVSLIGTSHMVSGYYTLWQGSEKNATGEGKQYWPTERQNIPFRIPWKLLTSSRHFLRSSTAFSREIAEREHGSQALKVLTLSKTLPQLWTKFQTFSGQHDTQTDKAKKKKPRLLMYNKLSLHAIKCPRPSTQAATSHCKLICYREG